MVPESPRRPVTGDRRFLTVAAGAAFAVVFVGFARSYFLKSLFGGPPLPRLVHVHALLMISWFVLFFTQLRLSATRRIALHRRLGVFGGVLAGLMVAVGFMVARRAAARDLAIPGDLEFLGFLLYALLMFSVLVALALLLRRRKDCHQRLMLFSCVSMVGPGVARIPLENVPVLSVLKTGGPFGLLGFMLVLAYACIGVDTWRYRRLHPAFVLGLMLLATEDLPPLGMFLASPTWLHLARWLVS